MIKKEKILKDLLFHAREFIRAVRLVCKHGSATVLRDGGTGLLTKAVFKEMALGALKSAMRTRSPISLIMADMDGLRDINSRLGHQAGDAYLQMSARIFMDVLREADIIGRYGGDEFIAVLPGTDKIKALVVVNKLKERLNEEKIGWSFGISEAQFLHNSVFSRSDRKRLAEEWSLFLENLISEADEFLYRDKAKRVK